MLPTNPKKDVILALVFGIAVTICSGLLEKSYVKVRVPNGYFLPKQGVHDGTEVDCAFACTLDTECEAFKNAGQQCQRGSMNTTHPYFPSYVLDGDTVMIESDKVALNEASAPYIGNIWSTVWSTSADNGTNFSHVQLPQYPNRKTGSSIFGNTKYKGAIIACGGKTDSIPTLKTCWFWSFAQPAWRLLEGELFHGHFVGKLVVIQDRLWMFMGSQTSGGSPHKKVESYDLKMGTWREEADADVVNAVQYFEAVVFDQTKVSANFMMYRKSVYVCLLIAILLPNYWNDPHQN